MVLLEQVDAPLLVSQLLIQGGDRIFLIGDADFQVDQSFFTWQRSPPPWY